VVLTREGAEWVCRCPDVPDALGRGKSKKEALERIKAVIRKKFGGDSEGGSAPFPQPVSPPPNGPCDLLVVEVETDNQTDT
jgi:predicted RNase H-like HicB family nuclease